MMAAAGEGMDEAADPIEMVAARLRDKLAGRVACVACGIPTCAGRRELHHFPIPKRHGGTHTVPLCSACHDLVDRTPLDEWPADFQATAWQSMWASMSREGRLFFMKCVSLMVDYLHPGDPA